MLGATVRAFGESATLAELLLTNTLVSVFAGVMPIPGGIGVSEAATAFCLTAIGIPSATAAAIALVFRLLTFYLPPIWGGSGYAGSAGRRTCSGRSSITPSRSCSSG
ncbi:MAG TPA: lysylphosphatidylglycerol synthase domain-containing protein [Actinomycetota bacterium]|nr:lysylphosphatidylglycerol synthase domain-containing protein [Actinomycetota bacterium]